MKLRDLEYLVAVDEERHFHRAAARCFVSQPTLSGQLKKLEAELDVLLVERTSRQVVMTAAGAAIAEQARDVLARVKAISERAQGFRDPMAGDLHIGLIPTVAPYLLPLIMPVIKREYPQLKLWLHEYQTGVLLEKLKRAELDVLILALPVDTDEFSERDLFNEPFQLAVPRGDALAQQHEITLADLNDRDMLLLEEGHCLRNQALDVCHTAGALENAAFRASSLETLRHMVGAGMGATLIPQLAVPARQTGKDPIRYLAFKSPAPGRRIGLLYRKGSYREAAFLNIQSVIRTVIAL